MENKMATPKTLSAAFPRCAFSQEIREITDIGRLAGNLRVAKAERAVEADVYFPFVIPYKKIYTAEREIMKAYMLNYVKIYPKIWWNCVKYRGVLYGKSVKMYPIYSCNCVKCTIG